MSTCPEILILYAHMDGELSRVEQFRLDAHVRGCESCRATLQSLSQVQGALFARPDPPDYTDDFEERFQSQLMSRMVTSQEARRYRCARTFRTAGSAVAALLFLSLGVMSWVSHRSTGTDVETHFEVVEAKAPVVPAPSLKRLRSDLATLVARATPSDKHDVLSLEAKFARTGSRLDLELKRALAGRMLQHDRNVLNMMAIHRDRGYVATLRSFLESKTRTLDYRRAIVSCAGEIATPEAVRLIRREIDRGFPLDEGLEALVSMGTDEAWNEVESVAKSRAASDIASIVAIVGGALGKRSTDLLLHLYLEGHQSERLNEELVRRRGVLELARRVVFGSRQYDSSEVKSAIALLALLKDDDSVDRIKQLMSKRRYAFEAVEALTRIGGENAMDALAARLSVRTGLRRGGWNAQFQEHVAQSISRLGDRGADYFLGRAMQEGEPLRREFVLAAGHCGSKRILPSLFELVKLDELKATAVLAIGLIGDAASVPMLRTLLEDRDVRVRRAALRALKRAGVEVKPRRWKGFA